MVQSLIVRFNRSVIFHGLLEPSVLLGFNRSFGNPSRRDERLTLHATKQV